MNEEYEKTDDDNNRGRNWKIEENDEEEGKRGGTRTRTAIITIKGEMSITERGKRKQ